jgi:O-succinylbenzoic acid--CoA ligase
VAVVVPTAASPTPDLQAVRDFVAAEHPRAWAPRQLVIRPGLPLLDSGKVDRQRLVRELEVLA